MKNSDDTERYKCKIIDDIVNESLDPNCKKLIDRTLNIKEKYKSLNEELKEIMQFEKEIKLKELQNESRKYELMNLESKLKETNSM